ncbi:transcriptional regulator [Marinicella sediminis]|uniref:Transcriptional regulator n=1 Tax=Marinicella sediminis TaxID=1792834 RepID=A0ABV7J9L2_9GAMM|nr:winged helix-turn-helix domain-containing protein [Marinicella sediminis]
MKLHIGPYSVDPTNTKVLKNGKPVKWGEKASQLFMLLLRNSPTTTSKEAIFDYVWKDRVVTENSLYKIISKLRQELAADGIEVESVFGEGYRLTNLTEISESTEQVSQNKGGYAMHLIGGSILLLITSVLMWWLMHLRQQDHLLAKMVELDRTLAVTKQAFISQINRRNELGELLQQRLPWRAEDSWEKRFYGYYDQMNEQERFLCQQTRAYSEGPLLEHNQAALDLLKANPDMVEALPLAPDLMTHLTIWLNKYHRVFADAEKMCLLYVGVEDGASYPQGFDQQLKDWIIEHQ